MSKRVAQDLAEVGADPWIERRAPVWAALSDLFVDAELSPDDHARIARTIRSAGFTPAEAQAILVDEVAPAFVSNLLSVAGEWSGWPEAAVRSAVLAGLRRRGPGRLLARRAARAGQGLYMDEWAKVAALIAMNRAETASREDPD